MLSELSSSMPSRLRGQVSDRASHGSACAEAAFSHTGVTYIADAAGHHEKADGLRVVRCCRADTSNFMAAIGPAFKTGFNDTAPVSNADIAPTLEKVLGVPLPSTGNLRGRALSEALKGGKAVWPWQQDLVSKPGDNGLRTIVNMQFVGRTRYFDAAGFPGRTVGLKVPARAK